MFERALAFHRQGNVEDAARGYEAVLSIEPAHLDALVHLGVLRLGQGRARDAEALLRRALAIAPGSAEAHGNLAATHQAMGRYDDASVHYRNALALKPDMLDARFGLAACSQALGRHDDAIACYHAILAADPAHAEANFAQATLFAEIGRAEEAIEHYRAALAADADFAEASHGLGDLLLRKGEAEEAVACFRQALDVAPDYSDARSALGIALYATGMIRTQRNDLEAAVACLHEALEIDAAHIDARLALGHALQRLERDDEAMAAYRAVLDADPDRAMAHSGLAMILCRRDREAEGVRHFQTALAIDPEHVFAKVGLASALITMGRHTEAIALCRAAVASQPDFPPSLSVLGLALAEMGEIEEAIAMSSRAVALAPDRPEVCYNLARLYKVRRGDPVLETLEAALPDAAALSPREGCWLRFALAKAYDDIGERDRGFAHLLEGNAIRRREVSYDEENALGAMDRIRGKFTAEFMASQAGLGEGSDFPVFIIGMPRSGTTLVEQVLASHPAVFGAGERTELRRTVERLSGARPFWQAVAGIGGGELRRMGAEYVAALRPLAPDAARITDKMPANFHFAGLIHMILPKARIIHVMRDPVDTCLSCFSKLFTSGQHYSYDLGELGRFHRAYQRLMAHWRQVLPAEVMLEVRYEALVDDLEAEARRILAHCDLPWDDACLEFHKTSRAVNTASMTQVRQPIYRGSVGRWRPDPALLRPLLEALEGDVKPRRDMDARVSLA